MHTDPILPLLVGSLLIIVAIAWIARGLGQPNVVAYLLAGVVLGPHGLGLVVNTALASRLGDLGLVLLMFFVGMEMSLHRLVADWKIAIGGTALQILASMAAVWMVGEALGWPLEWTVLIGFVVSMSSTAVAVSILYDWGELDSELGRDTMGILIVQDLAVIPMLLVIAVMSGNLGGQGLDPVQIGGGIAVLVFTALILRREEVSSFGRWIKGDPEAQVLAAALVCLGMALVTSLLGLSSALGALLAGILVSSTRQTGWVKQSLEPLRVLLLATFFVSMGLLIDLRFVATHAGTVTAIVASVLVTNTFLNALIVRLFGRSWRHSLLVGAVLAQAGDFSFVLAATGEQIGLVSDYGYQMTVAVIFATLLLSPLWIRPFRGLTREAHRGASTDGIAMG